MKLSENFCQRLLPQSRFVDLSGFICNASFSFMKIRAAINVFAIPSRPICHHCAGCMLVMMPKHPIIYAAFACDHSWCLFCWQAQRQTAFQETNLKDMDDPICPLCLRSIPANVAQSKHHLIPKLKGGKTGETILLHHVCHKEIHASLTEAELARDYHSIDALRQHPRIAKFINWVKKRPADFNSRVLNKRR